MTSPHVLVLASCESSGRPSDSDVGDPSAVRPVSQGQGEFHPQLRASAPGGEVPGARAHSLGPQSARGVRCLWCRSESRASLGLPCWPVARTVNAGHTPSTQQALVNRGCSPLVAKRG